MVPRRLYSSLPARAALTDAAAAKPRPSTRGRARPVRAQRKDAAEPSSSSAPTPSSSSPATHGRRLRRGLLSRTGFVSTEPHWAAHTGPRFEPVTLYPLQAGLHMGLTPAHMPLPLALGTKGYTSPKPSAAASAPLFERPAPPSPLSALDALPSGTTALGEHLRVSRAFAHPALSHHLASSSSASFLDIHADSHVTSSLDSAAAKHARAAEDAWDAALTRLGHREVVDATAEGAAQAKLDDALAGLNGLLARLDRIALEAGEAEEGVSLDSVKRKRKKKMNKHKYKKRRKATRALRKRLGK